MKSILVLFLALAGLVTPARADVGVTYYASSLFTFEQCSVALRAFDGIKYPIFGHLWGTFGRNTACLKRYIAKMERRGRAYQVRIYFQNETCYRAGRVCTRDEFGFGRTIQGFNRSLEKNSRPLELAVRKRAEEIQAFLVPYLQSFWMDVVIIQGLEDNWSNAAADNHFDFIKDLLPYDIFRNPVSSSYIGNASGIELHDYHARCPTNNPRQCVYNNDGYDVDFGGRERALDGAISMPGLRALFLGKQKHFGTVLAWWNTQGIIRGEHLSPRRRIPVVVRRSVILINKLLREIETHGASSVKDDPMDLGKSTGL